MTTARTQTALAHWPLTDPEWWMIDPNEWQEGQRWRLTPATYATFDTCAPDRPVWVRELLPIPDPPAEWPYDKLAWLPDGTPVAKAGDLPPTTMTSNGITDSPDTVAHFISDEVVIVRAWPDGTKPVRPARRFTAHSAEHGTETVITVDDADGGGCFSFTLPWPAQAAAFVAQLNGDQA